MSLLIDIIHQDEQMGVQGFCKIIYTFAPKCIREKEFKDYKDQIIALDGPPILYKFGIKMINSGIDNHLFATFYKSAAALRYGIKIIWVFDGKPPNIKIDTLNERRKEKQIATDKLSDDSLTEEDKLRFQKKSITITYKQIEESKYLLSLMGLPYLQSPGEAEAQCSAFDRAKLTNGVVTEDWDAILFGCKKMLKNFTNKHSVGNPNPVTEIDVEELLKILGMTQAQLIDLASILGNDYCSGIGNLKPVDAFVKFRIAKFDINDFLQRLNSENNYRDERAKYKIPVNFIENSKIAKDYYLNAPVADPNEFKIEWNEPNYEMLYSYLVDVKQFKGDQILQKINELKLMYCYYKLNNKKLETLSEIKRELNINEVFIDRQRQNYFLASVPIIQLLPPQIIHTESSKPANRITTVNNNSTNPGNKTIKKPFVRPTNPLSNRSLNIVLHDKNKTIHMIPPNISPKITKITHQVPIIC